MGSFECPTHLGEGGPAYGLNDAPVACCRALRKYLLNSVASLAKVGLRFRAPSAGPRLYFVFRKAGGAVGAAPARCGDIFWRGKQDVLAEIRFFFAIQGG